MVLGTIMYLRFHPTLWMAAQDRGLPGLRKKSITAIAAVKEQAQQRGIVGTKK